MANNRMWLIHKPSKLGVMLGKQLDGGWYKAPEKTTLDGFYEYLELNYDDGDNFILAMEDCKNSYCFDNWVYTEEYDNGFRKFRFKED